MNIIIFLIILLVLVIVHEFGHFFTAKKFGIRVDEFGFGFPPRLFGFKKGETEYTLNLLPFGGFVKIFGEDPTDIPLDGEKKRSFIFAPYKKNNQTTSRSNGRRWLVCCGSAMLSLYA